MIFDREPPSPLIERGGVCGEGGGEGHLLMGRRREGGNPIPIPVLSPSQPCHISIITSNYNYS